MSNLMRHIDRDEFFAPFDQVFDRLMSKSFPSFSDEFGLDFFHKGAYPKVDVLDYSDKIVIEAEIPGLTREDLDINVEDHVLTISGNKREVRENEGNKNSHKFLLRELKRSSFRRSFNLAHDVFNENKMTAKFENGLLFVEIPKKQKQDKATGFKVEIS